MYNKLFTKILDSSIWLEDLPTRIVWVTFLAMMDQDGTVALSGIGNVANRARVTEKEAAHAIKVLESPDEKNPGQEREGRRIERIPGVGWMVLNSSKYRDLIKAETIRAQTRERVRNFRCNADVTQANENVTPSETVSEAVAETEAKKTRATSAKPRKVKRVSAPNRLATLEVHGAKIFGRDNRQAWRLLVAEKGIDLVTTTVVNLVTTGQPSALADVVRNLHNSGLPKSQDDMMWDNFVTTKGNL